jgi:hypothetical protein
MSQQRSRTPLSSLPADAVEVARVALAETRLRGLPAAEEYRVIADRLYRRGIRDLPPGALLAWIDDAVAADYERLLQLRALGDQLHEAVAAGDPARAAWLLACELDSAARERLIAGVRRLNELEDERRAAERALR